MPFRERGSSPGRIPLITVVVPAHQASATIGRALTALEASDLPRHDWELIVVDDASTDDTALVAARHADVVIRLPDMPRGPAYARNRGSELARAPFVAFIDADVVVRPDTLRLLVEPIERDGSLGIVSAVRDTGESSVGFVTRYRALSRHAEQRRRADAPDALWSGCCMVRRSLLQSAGHFDEWHFAGPENEMRELGRRAVAAGFGVAALLHVTSGHLKEFRTTRLLLGDLWRRRVTHVRLVPRSSRLQAPEGLAIACAGLLILYGATWQAVVGAAAIAAGGTALLLDLPRLVCMARRGGLPFGLSATPLHLMALATEGSAHLAGVLLRHTVGAPRPDPTHEAYAEIGLEGWPPPPFRPRPAEPGPVVSAGEPG